MEYQKEKFRTLSCFVKPPWLSEVKRVVGIKKLCWSGWKLLGYEHWAVDQLDRLDQVDRLGKVFGRLTWDHNVNSGSRHWLSVSSQSFYWQGVAESQRAQITWIIWAIWHWFDSHSYSALPLGPCFVFFLYSKSSPSLWWFQFLAVGNFNSFTLFYGRGKNTLQEVFFYISTVKDCHQGKLSLCPIKSWSNVKRQNNLINDKSRTLDLHALKEEW